MKQILSTMKRMLPALRKSSSRAIVRVKRTIRQRHPALKPISRAPRTVRTSLLNGITSFQRRAMSSIRKSRPSVHTQPVRTPITRTAKRLPVPQRPAITVFFTRRTRPSINLYRLRRPEHDKKKWEELHEKSSKKMNSQQQQPQQEKTFDHYMPYLFLLLLIAWVYKVYDDNVQRPVIAPSILDNESLSTRYVIDTETLEIAGAGKTRGRSEGHKVKRINPTTGKEEYLYQKAPFKKQYFYNELFTGALSKLVLGHKVPFIYAEEIKNQDEQGQSKFNVLSQSLGRDKFAPIDLEAWAEKCMDDKEYKKNPPRDLGTAIVFDQLVGKTDSKLANFVMLQNANDACYFIDNETAFSDIPRIVKSEYDAFNAISEFLPDTALGGGPNIKKLHLSLSETQIDNVRDDLFNAVQESFINGHVHQLYEKFAAISDEDLEQLKKDLPMIPEDALEERITFVKRIRSLCQQHLEQMKALQGNETMKNMGTTTVSPRL